MTKTEMYNQILNKLTDTAERDFIQHEIDLLAKPQLEKNAQRDAILEYLAENPASICAAIADHLGVTLHSASGLLATLRKPEVAKVKREYQGKVPVYSLGSEVTEA